MRNKKSNEIRTRCNDVKVGDKVKRGHDTVLLVKNGKKMDTISINELAEELLEPGSQFLIIPPASDSRKAI